MSITSSYTQTENIPKQNSQIQTDYCTNVCATVQTDILIQCQSSSQTENSPNESVAMAADTTYHNTRENRSQPNRTMSDAKSDTNDTFQKQLKDFKQNFQNQDGDENHVMTTNTFRRVTEKVVKMRVKCDGDEYLIKWKGLG
jgi:hypothetical protein